MREAGDDGRLHVVSLPDKGGFLGRMEIGKYYMKKNQVLAAIGRYTVVVENYSMTSYQEEGFFRLFEAFTLMGLKPVSYTHLTLPTKRIV